MNLIYKGPPVNPFVLPAIEGLSSLFDKFCPPSVLLSPCYCKPGFLCLYDNVSRQCETYDCTLRFLVVEFQQGFNVSRVGI